MEPETQKRRISWISRNEAYKRIAAGGHNTEETTFTSYLASLETGEQRREVAMGRNLTTMQWRPQVWKILSWAITTLAISWRWSIASRYLEE